MEEFAGKPTIVGDWLEKQGIGKLKTLFEGNKMLITSVAFPLSEESLFLILYVPIQSKIINNIRTFTQAATSFSVLH